MQNISFNILLLIIIIYTFFTNVENLENTGPTDAIKEAVKQVYLADVESIRNLSAVAKKLQEDGGLVTPANMSIRGKVNINSPTNAKDLPANVALSVENATETSIRLKTKADDAKNITLTNNDGNLQMGNAKGADLLTIKADGNVAIKQDLTTGSLTSSTIKAPGAMKIESTAITTTGSLTTGSLTAGSLTTSGDITGKTGIIGANILANNNIRFNGSLYFNEINSRDYTPIVFTIDSKDNEDYSLFDRSYSFPHKTLMCFLFWDANAQTRYWSIRKRFEKIGNINVLGSVRFIQEFKRWKLYTVSIPPGKLVKFFGTTGQLAKYTPGYHEVNLNFEPHAFWAGYEENTNHIPDSYHMWNQTY